jgi:alcohol dehydrogenase class IV
MMWAATLAGIAFGNAGVHAPHGMAYAVAGLVRDFRPPGYPAEEPLVPHGMAVILNAPSSFHFTAEVSPERHLEGARLLGADTQGAGANDAGEVLANELIRVMRAVRMPNGLSAVGYTEDDVVALTEGAYPQQRLLQNAPREMSKPVLADLFRRAMRYW